MNNKGVALGEMLKLVEDGVLVRNTNDDASITAFVEQSARLTRVLKQAQEALETPLVTVGPFGGIGGQMKGKERRENNARIARLWRGEGEAK